MSAGDLGQGDEHRLRRPARSSTTSTSTSSPAKSLCLLGPNGAGKTTTMLALAGELPLIAGEVEFAGVKPKAPLYKRARNGHVLRHRGALGVQGHDACATTCGSAASTPKKRSRSSPSWASG